MLSLNYKNVQHVKIYLPCHFEFHIGTKNVKFVKILYKCSVLYADRKSKMATTAGHRLTLNTMGKCSNAFFSETTNMIKVKL
jgi:hypothetical protein